MPPLGWPVGLGQDLRPHQAGAPIHLDANSMFRRLTDKAVKQSTGKLPLDVGADRIARAALAALGLLEGLREATGLPIDLAWQSPLDAGIHAIEVYPGATLAAYGIDARGYKTRDGRVARLALLDFLGKHLGLPPTAPSWRAMTTALDAALCVLAGLDFLRGRAVTPDDLHTAVKEGWIWVRRPE